MHTTLLGYGSFFHTVPSVDFEEKTTADFLGDYQFFYAGRPAMKYAIELVAAQKPLRYIWLPNYYCPFVKVWIEHEYDTIRYYDLDPFDAKASLDWSLFDADKDLVILNNYWGMKRNILPEGKRPVVIEDHSHGWLSEECMNSVADLCFASLRKTLPLPLGGIFWKPKNSDWEGALYDQNTFRTPKSPAPMDIAWNLMHSAMSQKAQRSSEHESKEFMEDYAQGEVTVRENFELYPVTETHKALLSQWFLKDVGRFKRRNLDYLVPKIKTNTNFKLLTNAVGTPFGLLVLFTDQEILNTFKHYLITKQIYPAELWPRNSIPQTYKHLLNIHVDFRYSEKDLDYMADCINGWELNASN